MKNFFKKEGWREFQQNNTVSFGENLLSDLRQSLREIRTLLKNKNNS